MAGAHLIAEIRRNLRAAADPERAPGMQAYMKSEMPFLGVAATPMRKISKQVFAVHPLADASEWSATVLRLWREAKYREERYAAMELAAYRPYEPYLTPVAMPMFEEMIVTGAWWDYVDAIAAHQVGAILRRHPRELKPLLRRWSRDRDLWRRRTAILAQLSFKGDTDLRLLYDCIAPNLSDREFFIRKAIGWALRQYAWTDPEEIRRYVAEHEPQLSPLSRREALKNL